MKRTSSTVSCEDESLSATRRRSTPADNGADGRNCQEVDRWVAMINAELDADDDVGQGLNNDNGVVSRSLEQPVSIAATNTQSLVEVAIEFGRTCIDESTQAIGPGALIRLDQLAAEPVDLVVAGRTVARGELITVDGKIGVRIVEVLVLFLLAFFCGFNSTEAEERIRDNSLRRALLTATDEAEEESFSTKSTSRKPTDAASSRGSKQTKKNESLETSDGSLLRERSVKESKSEPIAITPPSVSRLSHSNKEGSDNSELNSRNAATGWGSTAWPLLAVVVAIVLGTRWLKKHSPTAARGLPSEAFDILGRRAVDQRTSVVIARCGSRLLVLSLSPHGMQTLAEITDPVEIECLAGLCRTSQRDQSLADTFRAMLNKPAPTKNAADLPPNSTRSPMPNESRWPERLMSESVVSPKRETSG